jgi:hypothetical protein
MTIDKVIKILPLATAIIVGLGILKTAVYYGYFGVNIISYLAPSDVLTLFLNDYNSILIFAFLGITHYLVSDDFVQEFETTQFGDFFEQLLRKYKWQYFFFFLICEILVLSLVGFSLINLEDWNIYLIAFCGAQLFTFLFISKKRIGVLLFKQVATFLVSCAIISVIPLLGIKEAHHTFRNEGRQICLILENERFFSSSTERYLGKTGHYYFFYDIKKHRTVSIKEEDVKRIYFYN